MIEESENVTRILVVALSLECGGTETHISRVFPLIEKRGYEVTVFSILGGEVNRKRLENNGIKVRNCQALKSSGSDPGLSVLKVARIIGELRRFLVQNQPDVVHTFLPLPCVVGVAAAILSGIKLRVVERRSLNCYRKRRPLGAFLEKFFMARASLVCGNSQAVVDQLVFEEGASADSVVLNHNGIEEVDLTKYDQGAVRRKYGVSDGSLVYVVVANLIEYKGHEDIVRALKLVSPLNRKRITLFFLGRDGGIQDRLEDLVVENGLEGIIRWEGEVENVYEYLSMSDVGILASHEEGFSNAVLEMMSFGVPVIATNVGGNPDAVVQGETGMLVPPKSPASLADAIEALAEDHALRSEMGRRGKSRIAESFSLGSNIDRYIAIYQRLCK